MAAAWASSTIAAIALLNVLHDAPIPASAALPSVPLTATAAPSAGRWRLIHCLAADCPCSDAVARYLNQRKPLADTDESIVVIGAQPLSTSIGFTPLLAASGFLTDDGSATAAVATLQIKGGPWLVIVDPAGRVRYSGGYAERPPRPGMTLQDVDILHRIEAGLNVPPFPSFGCLTDRKAQQAIDPLGLKY